MKLKYLIVLTLIIGFGLMVSNSLGIFKSKDSVTQTSNPSDSPTTQSNEWREQTVANINLKLKLPPDMTYREELADDYGNIRTMAFYIERKDQSKPPYELYALFQANIEATQQDLEMSKSEMDKTTIKETTLDGYKGIEGLILGQKTRYITIVQKDGRLFSVSTMPPTEENKKITEEILTTFDFK